MSAVSPGQPAVMGRPRGRWRLIAQLDEWLRLPMLVLSLAWLAILIVELRG